MALALVRFICVFVFPLEITKRQGYLLSVLVTSGIRVIANIGNNISTIPSPPFTSANNSSCPFESYSNLLLYIKKKKQA